MSLSGGMEPTLPNDTGGTTSMSEIPNKSNVELMKEAFPQKDEPAPDPAAKPDAVNEVAFKLIGTSKYKTPKFG
jgi:hypothetical protein